MTRSFSLRVALEVGKVDVVEHDLAALLLELSIQTGHLQALVDRLGGSFEPSGPVDRLAAARGRGPRVRCLRCRGTRSSQ